MAYKSIVKRSKASAIILGVLLLLLGLWTLYIAPQPLQDWLFISFLGGWVLLIAGCASCVTFSASSKDNRSAADIVCGVILIILSCAVFIWPLRSGVFVVCFLGALVFLTGIVDIAESVTFKKSGERSWIPFLIFGIVTLLFGLSAIIVPFWFSTVMVYVVAFALIFDGITEIIAGVRM